MYGKLEDGKLIVAPVNYNGISNFNKSPELMAEAGFKEVVETEYPGAGYDAIYTETDGKIMQSWEQSIILVEGLKSFVREDRNDLLNAIQWRIERYKEQTELGIATTDSAEMYMAILQYKQYLRDYPQSSEAWYQSAPLDFDTWYSTSGDATTSDGAV